MSYTPVAYIEAGGEELASTPGATFKLLGFVMSDHPSVRAHVDSILKKFRQRYWTLYNLKKHGFSQKDLVHVYKSMIRPVAEYCAPVFHTLNTAADSNEPERLQMQALKESLAGKLAIRNC